MNNFISYLESEIALITESNDQMYMHYAKVYEKNKDLIHAKLNGLSDEGHSGASAAYRLGNLRYEINQMKVGGEEKVIAELVAYGFGFNPIMPLTYADDEFNETCTDIWQNKRKSNVFKTKTIVYSLDSIAHTEPNSFGTFFTGKYSRHILDVDNAEQPRKKSILSLVDDDYNFIVHKDETEDKIIALEKALNFLEGTRSIINMVGVTLQKPYFEVRDEVYKTLELHWLQFMPMKTAISNSYGIKTLEDYKEFLIKFVNGVLPDELVNTLNNLEEAVKCKDAEDKTDFFDYIKYTCIVPYIKENYISTNEWWERQTEEGLNSAECGMSDNC